MTLTDALAAPTTTRVTDRTVHRLDPAGYVRDWLVGPVWAAECDDLAETVAPDGSPWTGDDDGRLARWTLTNGPDVAPLKSALYARRPLANGDLPPGVADAHDGGPLAWPLGAGWEDATGTGTWTRFRTAEDGLVDWSEFRHTPQYRRTVASCWLESDQAEWRTLEISSTGPVAVWVAGRPVGVFTDVSYMEPVTHRLRLRLESGTHQVVLSTWQVAFREVRHVASLRVVGLPMRVVVPAPGADETAAARAEATLDCLGVRAWAAPGGVATLLGPPGTTLDVEVLADALPGATRTRVAHTRGVVGPDGELAVPLRDDAAGENGAATMLSSYEAVLRVRTDDPAAAVHRDLPVCAVLDRVRYRGEPGPGGRAAWRAELSDYVRGLAPSTARALVADTVTTADLSDALALVTSRGDCADFQAVGLANLWHHVAADRWAPGTRETVRDALLRFKYWIDQPGLDAMCYFTENHQFVWHTAEYLVGSLFPDDVFPNAGLTGREHAAHGRAMALAWLRRKLAGGFSEFDSNAYVAINCLSLASLAQWAPVAGLGPDGTPGDPELAAAATALLDLVLVQLAAHSWKGIHGAAHGRSYVAMLRSGRFEETGPIMWSTWGTGSLNPAVLPAVVLAAADRYEVPGVVAAVAHADAGVWEAHQAHRGRYSLDLDLLSRPYGSDVHVWRTPHALLSSVQDYRVGAPGLQEHVWGATLGPEVQVFATHPATTSRSSSARPNAWAGQRVLPRVRQYGDAVVALHRIPADDPIGTTHLWFPAAHLDEVAASGPWLAGRLGDGFVAVATDGGFRPREDGPDAHQEWLPVGAGAWYVAVVGSTAGGTDLAGFVASLGTPEFLGDAGGDPAVRWQRPDAARIELGYTGPLLVDGTQVPIAAPGTRIAHPACRVGLDDDVAEFAAGGHRLRLDVRTGLRLEGTTGEEGPTDGR